MPARETWSKLSHYYDSYTKEFSADLALYGHTAGRNDRILEVGCGSGRILKYLLDMGHPVTGVDISDEMLKAARTKLAPYLEKGVLKLLNHDFSDGRLSGSYTLGLVTYYTFNYLLEKPEQFLRHLSESLFVHHTLLIDLFYPKTLHSPALDGQWSKDSLQHNGKTVPYSEKRSWNAKKHIEERLQVFEEDGRKQEIRTLRRYYSPKEIKDLLAKAGYTDVAVCKGYDGLWVDQLPESSLAGNFMVRARK
jgi:SAM-dependent methyltransferase